MGEWYSLRSSSSVISPALLFYPDRIQKNIDAMIKVAGGPERLYPHIKTYKCIEVIQMQMAKGIERFKCATLREAELLGKCKAKEVLLAYPISGPAQEALADIISSYPETKFAVLIDHKDQLKQWENSINVSLRVYIDVNVGMNRTGISPDNILELIQTIRDKFHLLGFHLYDGHIHDSDLNLRTNSTIKSLEEFHLIYDSLETAKELECIHGGSITFPIHAANENRILSPGTTLLWDYGYASNYPDLPFIPATAIFTRVVSMPKSNFFCLDLGHKAIASEMKAEPVYFPAYPNAKIETLSEEHMVISIPDAIADLKIGSELYGIPYHICPTVALHEKVLVVDDGQIKESWSIEARNRIYSN